MASVTFSHTSGGTTKTYIIKGALQITERKTQQSIPIPFPLLSDESNVINTLFGQARIFDFSFIMINRTDDYTDGTGTPSTYKPHEQKNWFMDDIFQSGGYHVFTDEEGDSYNGRIEDFQAIKSGDDPLKYDCGGKFTRGIVPAAGQFFSF